MQRRLAERGRLGVDEVGQRGQRGRPQRGQDGHHAGHVVADAQVERVHAVQHHVALGEAAHVAGAAVMLVLLVLAVVAAASAKVDLGLRLQKLLTNS